MWACSRVTTPSPPATDLEERKPERAAVLKSIGHVQKEKRCGVRVDSCKSTRPRRQGTDDGFLRIRTRPAEFYQSQNKLCGLLNA